MAADVTKYYVHKGDKTIAEGMTKEQILTAIQQAVEQGEITDVDTGFVTSLKEQNGGQPFKVWIGTEAQYHALTPERNVLYLITDDGTTEDLEEQIENLADDVDNLEMNISSLLTSIKANTNLVLGREGGSINPETTSSVPVYKPVSNVVIAGYGDNDNLGAREIVVEFVNNEARIISNTFPELFYIDIDIEDNTTYWNFKIKNESSYRFIYSLATAIQGF